MSRPKEIYLRKVWNNCILSGRSLLDGLGCIACWYPLQYGPARLGISSHGCTVFPRARARYHDQVAKRLDTGSKKMAFTFFYKVLPASNYYLYRIIKKSGTMKSGPWYLIINSTLTTSLSSRPGKVDPFVSPSFLPSIFASIVTRAQLLSAQCPAIPPGHL